MAYKNNSTANKKKGTEAERVFYTKFKSIVIRESDGNEDIHEHWDYLLKWDDRKVDVKSPNPTKDFVRVELVSKKQSGNKRGSLYGKSYYMAYRMAKDSDKFLFVLTSKLRELAKNIKDEYCQNYYNPEAYKKYIPRDSKGSVIAFIPMEDLEGYYVEL